MAITNQNVDDIDVDKELDELVDDTPKNPPEEDIEEDTETTEETESDDASNENNEEDTETSEDGDEGEEEDAEDKPEDKKGDEENPENTYKKKYVASQQENMVTSSRNKQIIEAQEAADALTLDSVTEDEVEAANPDIDWESASDTEKKLLKKDLLHEKKDKIVSDAIKAGKEDTLWIDKVNTFIEDNTETKFPKLSGKEDEFKKFCLKPTRRGVDIEDLVAAFLFEESKKPPVKKKGSLFNGKGNKPTVLKKEGITTERMEHLRTKNPMKYKELIKKGKVKIDL